MDLLERLIAERPAFHAWPDGKPVNWGIDPEVLRYIASFLKPGMNSLETGAGHTTVGFAIAGAKHLCVVPDVAQAERIRAYIKTLGIEDTVTFCHESSDIALPAGRGIPDRLDFVLIDGAHRFPFPLIDWHYTEHRVPVGGVIAVDDYSMPSVRVLHDFLRGEKEWELLRAFKDTSFFQRVKETKSLHDWTGQAINKPYLQTKTRNQKIKSLLRLGG